MSRIYTVRRRDAAGHLVRYVRANTLNAAVRAVAVELFEAKAATTEEIYQATVDKTFDVLDAVQPEQVDDIDDKDDPGPVPLKVVS